MSVSNDILGFKYQIYEGDDLKIYRTIRFKDYEHVVAIEEATGVEKIISKNDLTNSYVRLLPDAFMNIMITDQVERPDIYVCINKADKLANGRKEPCIIMRQAVYDESKCFDFMGGKIYVGNCISESTIQSNYSMKDYMDFNEINFTASIALYVDDTIDSIINTIQPKIHKRLNEVFAKIKKEFENSPAGNMIEGCADNLRELMESTRFINRYREEFNILQLDWPIDLGKVSYNSQGDLILNNKQHEKFENELRKFIADIKVIKYDKDIDISRIVSRSHSMVSDSNGIIYLIAYTIIGEYPVDSDIAAAMKH